MMNNQERNIFQLKSTLIVHYISEYCQLEKLILGIFQKSILGVDHKYKNKLFFYYGIHVGHDVFFDFENDNVSLSNATRYNVDEMFKSLNLNKIIKFEKKESLITAFKFNINSVIRKSTCFPFCDSCLKLASMRNKLAHEVDHLTFQEKDIIEKLPLDYLKKFDDEYINFNEYEIEKADDGIIALLSNIVYIKKIMEQLQEKAKDIL